MYAVRRVYVKQWDHQTSKERFSVNVKRGRKAIPGLNPRRISYVEEEVMYWRKAYHIHDWFVNNVQNGEDDCRSYCVDWDQLEQLFSVCQQVIDVSELVGGMVYDGTEWKPGMKKAVERRKPGLVIRNPSTAKRLLPIEAMFTEKPEYDEWYYNAVVDTRDWAKSTLADMKAGVPGEIYYESSW